jgi:hypothetical protein
MRAVAQPERERVEWEFPRPLLRDLREYCTQYNISECEAARKAIERYLCDRLLEEGE